MVGDKNLLFSLVNNKKRLEAARSQLIEEYNEAVFEDGDRLEKVEQALAANSTELNYLRIGIRAIKVKTDSDTLKEWKKEYHNR